MVEHEGAMPMEQQPYKTHFTKTVIRTVNRIPDRFHSDLHIRNLEEAKNKFISSRTIPKLKFKSPSRTEQPEKGIKSEIKFDLLPEATHIIQEVKRIYGSGEQFFEHAFGKRINLKEASSVLNDYMKLTGVDGMLRILWTQDLDCTGRMTWYGPNVRYNRPEARHYVLWLKNSKSNIFLREHGIKALAHHEIGTHFLRMHNEGLQPWYASRQTFGLRSIRSFALQLSEEGFAAVNTLSNIQSTYLFMPALLYYTACMAKDMTFSELYDHLSIYIDDPELRWKHVMRAKRTLADCNACGGNGNDQCYFAGAVQILRNLDTIDFQVLCCGKICIDEIQRVRRLVRHGAIKLPLFLKDISKYRKQLKKMAVMNGLIPKTPKIIMQIRTISRADVNLLAKRKRNNSTKYRTKKRVEKPLQIN